MYWRLTLDVGMSLATEPGLMRSIHSSDFSQRAGEYVNTWRDPVSRLLWLSPSWLRRDYYQNMRGLSAFTVRSAGMWQEVKRSPEETKLFSLVHPAGWTYTDVELQGIDTYLKEVNPSTEDKLYWALVSSGWSLAQDEGFVIYYHNLTDELVRRANWFALQWGRLYLHFAGNGDVRLYSWDEDTPLTDEPTLRYAGSLCGPGEQMARTGFIAITPIPGMGITLHFPQVLRSASQQYGSAEAAVGHGLLIPFPAANNNRNPDTEGPIIGHAGPLTIAINPYTPHVFGVEQTRYPSTGMFTDGWFDTGIAYTSDVDGIAITEMPKETTKGRVSASGSLVGPLGPWREGVDRQGRVKVTLSTADSKYTPFVLGYTVAWSPRLTARATTSVVPKVVSIEWSQDARLRNEGTAELIITGETARAIAERGDATFRLEYSADGTTWSTAFGGFARDWELEPAIDASGLWYRARCSLKDLLWKLEEAHVNLQTAFDWRTIANAVNVILLCAGYQPIDPTSQELEALYVPGSPTGTQWRYAPNLGDSGLEALDLILLHARQQGTEWLLRYDYGEDKWVTEKRAYSTTEGALTLSPYIADRDPDNGVFHYLSLSMRPEPPEANVIQVVGVSDPDSGAVRYISPPCINQDSIEEPSSPDYLGRAVLLLGTLAEAPSQREVNLMARRVYDAVAHRRLRASVTLQDWHPSVVPNVYVTVKRDNDEDLASFWIKRRTIRITGETQSLYWPGGGASPVNIPNYAETVTLELDTVWETEIDE